MLAEGLGEYIACKGHNDYDDYWGGLFGDRLTDEELCKVKACGFQFYYMKKPTCVPMGHYADTCDTSTWTCAGGSKYGYGGQQVGKAIQAIQNMNSWKAVDCPGTPQETCGMSYIFIYNYYQI